MAEVLVEVVTPEKAAEEKARRARRAALNAAQAANKFAWKVRTAAAWKVAAEAWKMAGELVAERMCREEAEGIERKGGV